MSDTYLCTGVNDNRPVYKRIWYVDTCKKHWTVVQQKETGDEGISDSINGCHK
jgi:hypothetical protein